MVRNYYLSICCVFALIPNFEAGGHGGGGHKKIIVHVPYEVKHHHHTHTIVKHVHHKDKDNGGGDHYEVLGYTYGEPKHEGGHKWGASDEDASYEGVNFGSDGGFGHLTSHESEGHIEGFESHHVGNEESHSGY